MRALLVEDDSSSALLSSKLLEADGFAVDIAKTARDGLTCAMVTDYDLIVLDLGLPDGSGLSVVQALRRDSRTAPIMILTGTLDKATTVLALDAGADDFLTKPILVDEFRARVRALIRRGGAQRTEQLVCGNVVLNRLTRQLFIAGAEVTLTAKELPLLEHLLLHRNEVVTRAELLERVWDMHFDPGSNVVDVNVARIRKKLTDAGADIRIGARRGMGFVLSPGDAPAV
ncbi:response regulator transcription factor [soil metagenome]|jgi:DNA-binding response OmpR family regulator